MSMLVIGLTGGIASGKSFVAECFEKLGAEILNADKIGHEVLNLPEVISRIRATWPQVEIINGQIDRRSLAQAVFGDGADGRQLRKLENITHPLIKSRIEKRLTELRDSQRVAVVLDVPLLFKAGWQKMCDKIVFVDVCWQDRTARALHTRGWDAQELSKRERFQAPLEQKRQGSTDYLDNSRSKDETMNQVIDLWQKWGLASTNTRVSS